MDALDMLKPCPICNGPMLLSVEGLYCSPCRYTYYQEDGESIVSTAERFNADWEDIVRDLAEEAER